MSDPEAIPVAVTIKAANNKAYQFREPTGHDLVAIDAAIKADPDGSDVQRMANLMVRLGQDGMSEDDYLNLSINNFKTISEELNAFFRLDVDISV